MQFIYQLDQPNWDSLPILSLDHILWEADCGIRAKAQICRDVSALYVHLSAAESSIRAEYTALLSPVHEDSCLEFFFMPEEENRYMNFEVNPNGCLHIGFGKSRKERITVVCRDADSLFHLKTAITEDGWEVFYQIPFSFLQLFYPFFRPEGCLNANFYKCGDKTPEPHFLSWNPVTSSTPDFHRPCDFGKLVFA